MKKIYFRCQKWYKLEQNLIFEPVDDEKGTFQIFTVQKWVELYLSSIWDIQFWLSSVSKKWLNLNSIPYKQLHIKNFLEAVKPSQKRTNNNIFE